MSCPVTIHQVLDNIIAVLGRNNRVCQIDLGGCLSVKFRIGILYVLDSAAMQAFPGTETSPASAGMDGSQYFPIRSWAEPVTATAQSQLSNVPFSELPKPFLLSGTHWHLVHLSHYDIPVPGTSRPALEVRRLSPPLLTRSILSIPTKIEFKGASEYLEEILARIDAPRLNKMRITFFNHSRPTTTLPVHQSKTNAEGTGKVPYRI
jgi:hypothetical protein